jgi:hypothetical protein
MPPIVGQEEEEKEFKKNREMVEKDVELNNVDGPSQKKQRIL